MIVIMIWSSAKYRKIILHVFIVSVSQAKRDDDEVYIPSRYEMDWPYPLRGVHGAG